MKKYEITVNFSIHAKSEEEAVKRAFQAMKEGKVVVEITEQGQDNWRDWEKPK